MVQNVAWGWLWLILVDDEWKQEVELNLVLGTRGLAVVVQATAVLRGRDDNLSASLCD